MLAQQGKSAIEIADDLCKGHNTIRNQIKALFSKIKRHSMQGAIEVARNFRLMYSKQGANYKKRDVPDRKDES